MLGDTTILGLPHIVGTAASHLLPQEQAQLQCSLHRKLFGLVGEARSSRDVIESRHTPNGRLRALHLTGPMQVTA